MKSCGQVLESFEKKAMLSLAVLALGNRYPDIPGMRHHGQSNTRIQLVQPVYCMCASLQCIPVLMGR